MRFTDWLKSKQGTGNEDVDLVASSMLEHYPAWEKKPPHIEAATLARSLYECNDEVAEAMARVYAEWQVQTGNVPKPETPDPMSLPYAPGAKTTLADARLQLVCAALAGIIAGRMHDLAAPQAALAIERADITLKAMEKKP